MDVDKSLDDLITDKRTANKRQSAPRSAGRQSAPNNASAARRETPYARPPPRSTDEKWVHDAFQGPGAARKPFGNNTAFSGTATGFTGLSPRIEVSNIHYEVTPADLKGIFSQAGTLVQGPNLRYDRSGRSTGIATLEYASPQQAKVAINKFDGAMTKGQTISIKLLPPARVIPTPAATAGRQQSGPTGASLLSRIGGGAGALALAPARAAPRGGPTGPARGSSGAAGRGASLAGKARPSKRAPATAGDLDKELDSFMKKENDVEMA